MIKYSALIMVYLAVILAVLAQGWQPPPPTPTQEFWTPSALPARTPRPTASPSPTQAPACLMTARYTMNVRECPDLSCKRLYSWSAGARLWVGQTAGIEADGFRFVPLARGARGWVAYTHLAGGLDYLREVAPGCMP